MDIKLHKNDLPKDLEFGNKIAIDCEFMGLNFLRDKLCLVQISSGKSDAHIIQLNRNNYDAPNLKKILSDNSVTKIFHFARADLVFIKKYLQIDVENIEDTKLQSKLIRKYTDKHGLKELCKELLNIDISKQQQSSDWGNTNLSDSQLKYAASDVLYLHDIKLKLDKLLKRENRELLAENIFKFLGTRSYLDLNGWDNPDIFDH